MLCSHGNQLPKEAKAIRCSVLVRLWDTSVYQIMIIKNNKWSVFAQ